MAGLHAGIYQDAGDISDHWKLECRFEPDMAKEHRETHLATWSRAVKRACHWVEEEG